MQLGRKMNLLDFKIKSKDKYGQIITLRSISMIANTCLSPHFSRYLTHPHLFTSQDVQHCAAISATAELLYS